MSTSGVVRPKFQEVFTKGWFSKKRQFSRTLNSYLSESRNPLYPNKFYKKIRDDINTIKIFWINEENLRKKLTNITRNFNFEII